MVSHAIMACAVLRSEYMNACCKIMCQLDEGVLVLEVHRHGTAVLLSTGRHAQTSAFGGPGENVPQRPRNAHRNCYKASTHADMPLLGDGHRSLQVRTIMQLNVPA